MAKSKASKTKKETEASSIASKRAAKPARQTEVPGKKRSTSKAKSTAKKNTASPTKSISKSVPKVEAKTSRFAVIKLAGTQLTVVEGEKYTVKKIAGVKGETVVSTDVLLLSEDGKITLGKPTVSGAKVTYTIDSQKKGKKLEIFKYKAKSRYRRRFGDRPLITRILVTKIEG
ncbi:50S ribosomal protein L21 [Candidatus Nomurabacteria bacterium]|nr:50S ribosomal protein L21 [Candidatus Nomurabacteria bacterium]